MLLYLVPLACLFLLIIWVWTLADALRKEREYFWVIALVFLPPIAVPGYILNFLVLGDEKRGIGAILRRSRNAARIAELREGLKHDDIIGRREELASLLMEEKQYGDALHELRAVLDFDEENLQAHYQAATALAALGKLKEAEAFLGYVFEEDPSFRGWQAALDYAELLTTLERGEEALEAYDRILSSLAIPEVVTRRAMLLIGMGRRDEARAALTQMLAEYAKNPGVHGRRDEQWIQSARKLLQQNMESK